VIEQADHQTLMSKKNILNYIRCNPKHTPDSAAEVSFKNG